MHRRSEMLFATVAVFIACTTVLPVALAQGALPDPGDLHPVTPDTLEPTEEQRVLAVEDAWINAEIDHDEGTLRRVIDDRFVYNSNDGRLSDKTALISGVLSWNMTGQTITDRTVLVDGNLAVVFGTTELRFTSEAEGEHVSTLRYTATYVKRHDQWRAIALQMAKLEPE